MKALEELPALAPRDPRAAEQLPDDDGPLDAVVRELRRLGIKTRDHLDSLVEGTSESA